MIDLQFGEVDRIRHLAEKLSTIPACPRTQGAVEALGEDLAELCDSWEEAEWLVTQARSQWDEWKGRRGLLHLLDDRRRPQLPPANQAQDLGPKPEISCRLCEDWGHLEITDGITGAKRQDWCKCPIGQHLKLTFPGFMKMLNKGAVRLLNPRPDRGARITETDLEINFQGRQNGIENLIAQERAVLESDSSNDRKEIARQTLKQLGVAETEVLQ